MDTWGIIIEAVIFLIVSFVAIALYPYGITSKRKREKLKMSKNQLTEDIKKLTAKRAKLCKSIEILELRRTEKELALQDISEKLEKQRDEAELTLRDIIKSNRVCGKDSIEEVRSEINEVVKKAAMYFYNKTSFRIQSIYVKHEPYGMLTNLEFTIK